MANYKFYVVRAQNAVMVADGYPKAVMCMDRYFYGFKNIKGYQTFEEAQAAALKNLAKLITVAMCPDSLPINKVVTVRDVLGLNGYSGYFDTHDGTDSEEP